jgi:hypothetical protein
MHIDIRNKQIGNRLDNLILNKNRSLNLQKTLSKRNSEKESHFSQSKTRRQYNNLQLYINKTMQIIPALNSQR